MSQFMALIVEDDALQREFLSSLLKDEGLEVIECATGEAAELVIAAAGTELLAVVTDVNLEGEMTGVELAAFAKGKFPHLTVVVVSGKGVPNFPRRPSFWASLTNPGKYWMPSASNGLDSIGEKQLPERADRSDARR